ncbi:uncharacterized protein LOC107013253 [Solanum pennellii]|uniref:Uncharacterized protein LOC107013253 n=1 Tax=Solanum pennellii TaxID=28526 RepID=A0ABM1GBJ4_SOLPN|nr:uncharacterized protein LOC107013253 [Solanum pennellii]
MLLQTTYQDKRTQTEPEKDRMEEILKAITTLSTKVDSMDKELQKMKNISQQHDYKNAELCRSEDRKIPELQGDVGKLHKTHDNVCLNAATTSTSTTKGVSGIRYTNSNMKFFFDIPVIPKNQKDPLYMPPQTTTYSESLNQDKNAYNHITRSYIENLYKIQNYLNSTPRSQTAKDPHTDFITQKLQGYNKLIAQPGTNANLVKTCYSYGLLNTIYTQTGDEISTIPELYKAFMNYKRITKGTLFYIKFYSAPAEILFDEIKPIIQVIKIGLTRDMIIPEDIGTQQETQRIEIQEFYANKRVIGLATILNELTNNYLNENSVWSYYVREQVMIYSNSREIREQDMEEIRQWILSLLKPEQKSTTRELRKEFISNELLTRYCKIIGQKYPDHICSKCQGEDNVIPDVQIE